MELEKDEITCDGCDGEGGSYTDLTVNSNRRQYFVPCEQCRGEGKLNWIENIVGKKGPFIINHPGPVIFEHQLEYDPKNNMHTITGVKWN